jgi:hypothetical protein
MKKNDNVKIVIPEIFVRCGYPESISDNVNNIRIKYTVEIRQLLYKILGFYPELLDNTYDKILNELTYLYLRKTGFGGNERRIYTRIMDKNNWDYEKEKVMKVTKTKIVTTGTYVEGSYYDKEYPGEYEPPKLINQKKHKILELDSYLWIEEKNVEKVVLSPTISN